MSVFSSLFTKATNSSLFAVFAPLTAPAVSTDYLKAYTGWVFACVRAISTEVATIELDLQQLKADGEWERVAKPHPAMKLLHHVNPFMTSDELWFGTQAFIELTGSAYWYIAYNKKKEPVEIWLLDPTKMTLAKDSKGGVASYTYRNDKGEQVNLQPFEIIHFKDFNPTDIMKGWGTVKAAAIAIDIDTNASQWNRNFFYNNATPTFTLESEGNLTPEQRDRMLIAWKQKHQGVGRAGEPAILEGGLKANILSHSPRELAYVDGRKMTRDEILAIFNVPKSILGISETGDSRSDAEAAEYIFSKRVTYPRMKFLATRLSEFYLPLWGLSGETYRFFPRDIVPQNVETDIKRKQAGLASGYYTINEVRAEEGLEAVDGGDETLVPSTLRPLSQALAEPQPQPEGDENEPGSEVTPPQKHLKAAKAIPQKRQDFIHTSITHLERHVAARLLDEAKRIQKDLKTATKAAGDDTSSQLEERVFAGWVRFVEDMATLLGSTLANIVTRAGTDTALSISITAGFDSSNPRVTDWLREHALESATQVSQTLQADMRPILQAGVAEGKSTAEIAADLKRFFAEQSEWRATRIARTEVIEAYAQGSHEAARQIGVKEKKWLTAGDGRVDEHCLANERAGWIAREDAFPTGHIAPVTHPNCRCTLIYRNEGD